MFKASKFILLRTCTDLHLEGININDRVASAKGVFKHLWFATMLSLLHFERLNCIRIHFPTCVAKEIPAYENIRQYALEKNRLPGTK